MKRRVVLLGCGCVGGSLVSLIERNQELIAARSGVELEIARVLVRDLSKPRPVERALLTDDPLEALATPSDIVVEVIGGVEPAGGLIREAIRRCRNVVTANKALLAQEGGELFEMARRRGVRVGFEASVCGGVPIVRALSGGLAGDRITSITAIVNGTCNYVLTRMLRDRLPFDEAVRRAQLHGFAEADPTLDLSGRDSAQKLQILVSLAFGASAPASSVYVQGIERVSLQDLLDADARGLAIKLLAQARPTEHGFDLRVAPTPIPLDHPLARVDEEFNAVMIEGEATGRVVFYGKGAGGAPTASAVLSDVIDLARSELSRLEVAMSA